MKSTDLSKSQLTFLVLLRWLIGWHLLYEGLIKITNPAWSSKAYLASAEGIFGGIFQAMAQSESLLRVVDYMNMWGLTIIGLALILGIFTTQFSIAGAILLLLYFLAHPPLFSPSPVAVEGSYLFVNKTLIESCALVVLALFPTAHIIGIQRFFKK
ncbi:MAG: DoxX family membrane protein [Bacteroidota bacterium]